MNIIFFSNTRNVIFKCNFREKIIFAFLTKRVISKLQEKEIPYLTNIQKISYFHVFFWEKSSFIFCQRSKIKFLGKRNIIFLSNARKIIFQCNCFGKTISPEKLQSLQGSSYFHVFLFEKNLSFFVLKIRSYFRGKKLSFFLTMQERSYSRATFWEDHLFRTSGKRKMVFRTVSMDEGVHRGGGV